MSRAKRYTKEQKHLIKQCMIDADIMGLGRAESITYVKSRLGLDEKQFSEGSYKKYRSEALSDETNVEWITYYARQGFVEFYRKRISEMEMIQKETFKQWFVETNRGDSQKDKRLILSLVAELRANNQHLASLGMVTPIIATIKNIMDNNHSSVQYPTSRETTDITGPQETSDQQYSTAGESESTESEDINRKF